MLVLEAGVESLTVDNPMADGFHSFGSHPASGSGIGGHGLSGVFPYDLTACHDGARVPLATGLGFVRVMVPARGHAVPAARRRRVLRARRLRVDVGDRIPPVTRYRVHRIGLFVGPVASSPFDPRRRTVPGKVGALVTGRVGVLLEDRPIRNTYHWYRLTAPAEPPSRQPR